MTEYNRSELVKVAAATIVGTAVEWYDFYIAGIAASLVWPQFFPSKDPAASLLLSLISYGKVSSVGL